jgi:D-glycero-D-manno-heptose 1,7-bisphosphate phosphatase
MTALNLQPAVFLDRDGTLIRDVGYLTCVEQIEILKDVPAALRALRAAGFKTVVVTNQSAVARGWLSEVMLKRIHRVIQDRLADEDARLDAIYYCPHHPTEGIGDYRRVCDCRKPSPGMIHRAAAELILEPKRSFVLGDQEVDLELALRVGAVPLLVRSNGEEALVSHAEIFDNIKSAADWIVARGSAVIEDAT